MACSSVEASCNAMADSEEQPPSSGRPGQFRPEQRVLVAACRASDWFSDFCRVCSLRVPLRRVSTSRRLEPLSVLSLCLSPAGSWNLTGVARASYRDWLATTLRTGQLLKKQFV